MNDNVPLSESIHYKDRNVFIGHGYPHILLFCQSTDRNLVRVTSKQHDSLTARLTIKGKSISSLSEDIATYVIGNVKYGYNDVTTTTTTTTTIITRYVCKTCMPPNGSQLVMWSGYYDCVLT
jgi:hypothetical protein